MILFTDMQHFFNLAVDAGGPKLIFTPDQIAAYVEPVEFARAVAALASKPQCVRRATVIRNLFTA